MKINRRKFVVTTVTLIGGIPFSGITLAKDKFKPVGFGIVMRLPLAKTIKKHEFFQPFCPGCSRPMDV